jgi:hypothetical protein
MATQVRWRTVMSFLAFFVLCWMVGAYAMTRLLAAEPVFDNAVAVGGVIALVGLLVVAYHFLKFKRPAERPQKLNEVVIALLITMAVTQLLRYWW